MHSRRHGIGAVWRARQLRNLVLANFAFKAAEMGVWIAVTVEANRRGGIRLAGLVLVVQLAPAAVISAGTARLVRRFGAHRTLVGSLAAQCLVVTALAVVIATAVPTVVLMAVAAAGTMCVVATRPAQAAVFVTITDDPRALTAVHVALGWSDSVGTLSGPAITAVALAQRSPAGACVAFAVLLGAAAALASGVGTSNGDDGAGSLDLDSVGTTTESPNSRRGIGSALALVGIQAFVVGCLDLLVVVVAVDVVHAPTALAGWLATALGAGGIVGALLATVLVGRRSVWPAIVPSGIATAMFLALAGHVTSSLTAIVVFTTIGAALAFAGVVARCALQRIADTTTIAQVFAQAETADTVMLLAAAIALPAIVTATDATTAPTLVAAVVAVVFVCAMPLVRAAERSIDLRVRLRTLAECDLFAGLDAAALATLARNAVEVGFAPGAVLMREGEPGDCFHLIVTGTVAVEQGGRHVVDRGSGEGVGEAALLTDAPRNATLTATTAVETLRIEREPFLLALGLFGETHFADL